MDKEIELFAQKAMLLERIKNQRQNLGNLFVTLEKKCNNIDNVADGIIWLRNNKQIVGIATAILVILKPIKTIKLVWKSYKLIKFVSNFKSIIKKLL